MKKENVLESYKRIEDLLLNYSVSRAFLNDGGLSLVKLVERILCKKHSSYYERKAIRRALLGLHGRSSETMVAIPRIGLNRSLGDIVASFVHSNILKMVKDYKETRNDLYPIKFIMMVQNIDS